MCAIFIASLITAIYYVICALLSLALIFIDVICIWDKLNVALADGDMSDRTNLWSCYDAVGVRWVTVDDILIVDLMVIVARARWVDIGVLTDLLIAVIGARYVDIDVRLSINTSTERAVVDCDANRGVEILIKEIAESIIAFA